MLSKMKKLKLLVIMMSCVLLTGAIFPGNLFAETVTEEWVARYDGPANSVDLAWAIAVDTLDNVYVTGRSLGSGTGADYATIKYAPDGTQLWVRRYDGPANSGDGAAAIAVDTSGNVYVTGATGEGLVGSDTSSDYATVKYDADGNELWVATYNSPANSGDAAHAIALDTSGNVYVTGLSLGSGTSSDYATVKYDTNGNELWVRRYNGPGNSSDVVRAIALDSSGNVYVTGESLGSGTSVDYATVKYDTSTGEQLWVARYNGPANSWDNATAITLDSSGNVYVTGLSLGSGTSYDYATIKYAPDGAQLWVRRYDGPANNQDSARAIAVDTLDNVYVTGLSWDGSGTGFGYATVKYAPDGNEKWVARYDGPVNSRDFANAIAVDGSGNVYVTGQSEGSDTSLDYATVKYSPFEDPAAAIADLIATVISLNLQQGISNSLDAKLGAALQAIDDINANNDVAAINTLEAFINAVEAQSGDKIATEDAVALIAAAQAIIDILSGA